MTSIPSSVMVGLADGDQVYALAELLELAADAIDGADEFEDVLPLLDRVCSNVAFKALAAYCRASEKGTTP